MNKFSTMSLAAALTMAVALPASAAVNRIGTVDFGPRLEVERQMTRFTAPMTTLILTAKDNSVQCRAVTVKFENGRSRVVFSGMLRENRAKAIDLPGFQRNVKSITMTCRSLGRRGADVVISGNMVRPAAFNPQDRHDGNPRDHR